MTKLPVEYQVQKLERRAEELSKLIPEVAALQKQWQSALVDGCSDLKTAVLKYEGELIRHALLNTGGSLVRAALSLNMSYQALGYLIDNRHPGLLRFRSQKRTRSSGKNRVY